SPALSIGRRGLPILSATADAGSDGGRRNQPPWEGRRRGPATTADRRPRATGGWHRQYAPHSAPWWATERSRCGSGSPSRATWVPTGRGRATRHRAALLLQATGTGSPPRRRAEGRAGRQWRRRRDTG